MTWEQGGERGRGGDGTRVSVHGIRRIIAAWTRLRGPLIVDRQRRSGRRRDEVKGRSVA